MARDRAAYMRDYRKRMKLKARGFDVSGDVVLTIDMPGGGHAEYRAKDETAMVEVLVRQIVSLGAEVLRLNQALVDLPYLDRATRDQLIGYARRAGVEGVPEIDAAIERGEKGTPPTSFLKFAYADAVRGPILSEEVDDLYGGVAPPGRTVLGPSFGHSRPAPKPGK